MLAICEELYATLSTFAEINKLSFSKIETCFSEMLSCSPAQPASKKLAFIVKSPVFFPFQLLSIRKLLLFAGVEKYFCAIVFPEKSSIHHFKAESCEAVLLSLIQKGIESPFSKESCSVSIPARTAQLSEILFIPTEMF